MEQQLTVSPTEWIRSVKDVTGRPTPPMIYVAHPVAAVSGDVVAWCSDCETSRLFSPPYTVDTRLLCQCGAKVGYDTETSGKRELWARRVVEHNLARALRWWRWLHVGFPEATFIMPWYVNVLANGEADRELIQRGLQRGLRDDERVAALCDAVLLIGPRVSDGMHREAMACRHLVARDGSALHTSSRRGEESHEDYGDVLQVLGNSGEPPDAPPHTIPWKTYRPTYAEAGKW